MRFGAAMLLVRGVCGGRFGAAGCAVCASGPSLQQQPDREQYSEEQDVARRGAQNGVQLPAAADPHHAPPCRRVRCEVEQGKRCRSYAAVAEQREAERCGCESQCQIKPAAGPCAQPDDQRAFAAAGVLFAVAVVVDRQQGVDRQSAGRRNDARLPCPAAAENVTGTCLLYTSPSPRDTR